MVWASIAGYFRQPLTSLWATKMKHTRWLLYGWKLFMITPAAVGAWGSWKAWQQVEHHPELKWWPYNQHGDMGLAWLVGVIALVTIASWSFVNTLLIYKLQSRRMTFWCVIDLGIAILSCYAVSLTNQFLPSNVWECTPTKVANWQVIDGQPSVFQKISLLEGEVKDATKICMELTTHHTLAGACAGMQCLVAYIAIFSDERPRGLLNAWRPAFWLLNILLVYPVLGVIWIHQALVPPARLHISRAKKALFRLRRPRDLDIPQLVQYQPSDRELELPKTKLVDILCIEHLLLNIVGNMHYVDVVNLSLTCRATREVVFPRNDMEMRVPKLKASCCNKRTRKTCLYCNKIMCYWCTQTVRLPAQSGQHHTTKCRPYCRTCYYAAFSQHPSGWKRPCKGHENKARTEDQDLCLTCAASYSKGMWLQRERRFQQLAIDIAFGRTPRTDIPTEGPTAETPGSDNSAEDQDEEVPVRRDQPVDGRHCGLCKAELNAGMRWWVCGVCGGECRDSIHPVFVRKREMWNLDVERTGGADGPPAADVQVPWWKRWLRV